MKSDIEVVVRNFLFEALGQVNGVQALSSKNLISDGYLDSFGIIELSARIEDHFDMTIPSDRLSEDDFSSVSSIVNLCIDVLKFTSHA